MRRSRRRFDFRRTTIGDRAVEIGRATGSGSIPVAFAHGFACSAKRADRRTLEMLVNSDDTKPYFSEFIAPQLPGFGGSEPLAAENTTVEAYADWFIDVLEATTKGQPVVLLGESLGGAVASLVTIKRPDLVHSLLTFNSIGGAMPSRRRFQWMLSVTRMALPRSMRSLPQYVSSLIDAALVLRHPIIMWRLSRDLMSTNLALDLPAIKNAGTPTQVVFSDRDPLVLRNSADTFRDALGIEPHFVSGDHRSFIEQHPVIKEKVASMLRDASASE